MKFVITFLAIIFSITQVDAQRNEIPEVAFIFEKKVIKIDTLTFKKLLVVDTIQNPNHENIYCSNFSDLFHLPRSYQALLFYLNSSFVILNTKSTPSLVPSTKLCKEYIDLKIKEGKYSYFEEINSNYILSDDIKFDILLFPSLRDTLNKLGKEVISYTNTEEANKDFLKNKFNSDKSTLDFIKFNIELDFKNNNPYSKGSLQIMTSMLKNIIAQQKLNKKVKKEVKINYLVTFNDIFFAIKNMSINNYINDIPLKFVIDDSLRQSNQFALIYYCPIWDINDIKEIKINKEYPKSLLPVGDYYFWIGNNGIKKFPATLTKVYKIRRETFDSFQKIIVK